MIALYIVLGIIALIIAVALIKALLFVPKKDREIEIEEIKVDVSKAAQDLSDMIKCKTVSHRDRAQENDAEFEKYQQQLQGK